MNFTISIIVTLCIISICGFLPVDTSTFIFNCIPFALLVGIALFGLLETWNTPRMGFELLRIMRNKSSNIPQLHTTKPKRPKSHRNTSIRRRGTRK